MALPPIPGSASFFAAKRGGELAILLTRFGFGELVVKSGLARLLPKGLSPDPAHHHKPAPVRLRLLVEELGPTFIKAGQVLSTRPDLVPPDFIRELKKLQANVPPAPWQPENPDDKPDPRKHVHALLQQQLGDRLETDFREIDPAPLAAASMAQVHAARLSDGTAVVLKILRPNIDAILAADLQLMHWLVNIAGGQLRHLGFDAAAVIGEFDRQLARETDLRIEMDSTRRLAEDFADQPAIHFPSVHPALTTRRVLTLQRIEGQTLLADLDPATLSREQRHALVAHAADAVFRQCLAHGFFHADPHPGNLFVDPHTASITFIDCGMTGSIDPASAEQLAQITHGAIEGELERVVRTAVRLADADPAVTDDRAFRGDVWQFIDHFRGGDLESLRMGKLLNEFFEVLRKHHLRCPADIVYLIKALTTIEGVAQDLAPDFDLVGHVRPYVSRLVRRRFGLAALRRRLRHNAAAYADLLDTLPHQFTDLLRMVRQNRTTLQLEHHNLNGLLDELDRASKSIAWALVIAAIIMGAAIIVLADRLNGDASYLSVFALLGFCIAVAFGLYRLSRKH